MIAIRLTLTDRLVMRLRRAIDESSMVAQWRVIPTPETHRDSFPPVEGFMNIPRLKYFPRFGEVIFGVALASCLFSIRPAAAASAATVPSFSNVFIIVEENHSYSQIVGNPSMPYLNMLINNYALAMQYFANQHHSLPNYLWITSGSNDGVTLDNCSPVIESDNAVRELNRVGLSWKAYEEDLPSVGYLGCITGNYVKRHDPFLFYDTVLNSATQTDRVVPFSQLAADIANNNFARYNFITPNLCDDMHSHLACSNGCTSPSSSACLTAADQWLSSQIGPLLNTDMFQPGGSGLLIITFDESVRTDDVNGGGHVPWIAISPLAKPGYRSTAFYQHQSTLRLMLKGLGVTRLPQGAATAPEMSEFFN
jgi:acid phosphatase